MSPLRYILGYFAIGVVVAGFVSYLRAAPDSEDVILEAFLILLFWPLAIFLYGTTGIARLGERHRHDRRQREIQQQRDMQEVERLLNE